MIVSIIALVTSGGGDKDAPVGKGLNGVIGGLVVLTTQAQVDDNTVGTVTVGGVTSNKVQTRHDARVGTGAATGVVVVEEDLDTIDVDVLGDTVCGRANGTGNVGAVTAVIVVDIHEGFDLLGATAKILYQGLADVGEKQVERKHTPMESSIPVSIT